MSNLDFHLVDGGDWENAFLRLTSHLSARNQVVAAQDLLPGTVLIRDSALSSVLLASEKSIRCDACFRLSGKAVVLKKCSGCIEYWYCGEDCQTRHWKTVHKFMCKHIAKFRTSIEFQALPKHQQTDAMLLSHLVAEHGTRVSLQKLPTEATEDLSDPLLTFFALLPFDSPDGDPPVCSTGKNGPKLDMQKIHSMYQRFGNNNFVVHSHLDAIAHGIFPLSSRLLNHSCEPNAIVTYLLGESRIRMEVKALTKVKCGEEITIPYFDPALPYQRRQEISQYSYGFKCTCPPCVLYASIKPVPELVADTPERISAEQALCQFVFPDATPCWPTRALLHSLPQELLFVLHEDFLPQMSSVFKDAAHDGHYEIALRSGLTLLATYMIIYPPLYPQTGIHSLELAKTAWNASISEESAEKVGGHTLKRSARQFLDLALDSLAVLGQEGDADTGPAMEARILNDLLETSS